MTKGEARRPGVGVLFGPQLLRQGFRAPDQVVRREIRFRLRHGYARDVAAFRSGLRHLLPPHVLRDALFFLTAKLIGLED